MKKWLNEKSYVAAQADADMIRQSCVFRFVSLMGIIAVIMWHSECGSHLEKWLVPVFAHWSVPWFFFCSAIFFKESILKYGVSGVAKKKFMTLFLPYVLWCLIGWCMWMPTINGGFVQVIFNLFAINTFFPGGNYPLWYTRALMEYMFIYGLCVWFARLALVRIKIDTFIMATVLFAIICSALRLCGIGFSPFGDLLFFIAGLCVTRSTLWRIVSHVRGSMLMGMVMMAVWICVLATDVKSLRFVCENVGIALMIVILLRAINMLPISFLQEKRVGGVCMLASIVYFSHGPIMRGIIKYGFGGNDGLLNAGNGAFIMQATLFPPLIFLITFMFKKCCPRICGILSGGRI